MTKDCQNKSFCILPWIHMNLNPDGRATLCCVSHQQIFDEQGRSLNAQTHSLTEIWNSSGMKDIRRRMAAGERLPHCDYCFNEEAFGHTSYRNRSNEYWLNRPDAPMLEQMIEESPDGVAALDPMYFDLHIGNTCNLKCTVCKPLYSSQIERDPVHSKWNTDAPYTRLENRFGTEGEWSDSERLLDEIMSISGNVAKIQLVGGEPTINRTQIAFLRNLCAAGRAGDIDLIVVTNLSNVRRDIYDLFAQFKSLSMFVSVDGTQATYEYVRFPGKWSSLANNIGRLRETLPGVQVQITLVLQAVNALNVVDVFDWADSENIPIQILIGRGLDEYNDFRIMPLAVRSKLRERFESYFARKGNRVGAAERQHVELILAEIDATDFSEEVRRERIKGFMHFINDMDKSRRLSFKTAAAELYDDVVAYAGGWDSSTRYA